VLYETERPGLTLSRRLWRILKLLPDPQFLAFLWHKVAAAFASAVELAVDQALRFIHAAPRHPNAPPPSLETVISTWGARGVKFHVTSDVHGPESLRFVESLDADIGLIYATRILKPSLYSIPRRGSINIHKHKLPDYRGSGAPGLWELRDGCAVQTITVHRVVPQVDAGAVLMERAFPIEPFDTLESLQLKSDVIGVDVIVDVLRDEHLGQLAECQQPAGGRVYKGLQPHQVYALERKIRAARRRWRPAYSRPLAKLLPRLLVLPLLAIRNHRRRRTRRCPVIILFHHLVCDRPKHMGIPTAQYARQVSYLKRHYRIVSLPEAVALLQRGEVDVPTVVLTLDDGYAENLTGLRAVAECEGVPVTICVCTRHVSDRSELAHDLTRSERGFASMGWSDVRFLDRHGVTIASHTRTHFNCGTGDYATLAAEIVSSKCDLESELGHPIDVFAFPRGRPENISTLAYQMALQNYPVVMSAAGGSNTGPMTFPMHLRRFSHPDSVLELEFQLQEILDRPPAEIATPPMVTPHADTPVLGAGTS
jgi:peptidoglycan/xylan/chitin deacetylase (PgdA/CDA1 family)